MPVSTSINQQTPPLAQGETRKQEHNRRAGGLRLFCQNLYFSLRATFKPLCPLAFFVHLSCQNCTCGKQRKSLTHSFYRTVICIRYVCSTNQEETSAWKVVYKALHNPLATVTQQSPQKLPVFSSFPFAFYC